MTEGETIGPIQVDQVDIAVINDAFRQLVDRLDEKLRLLTARVVDLEAAP